MQTNNIITGDCMERLDELDDNSIHACVTDPPYGLAFMGRDWDDFEPKEYQEWCENWARRVKRVLKPGAHLLAFSGNRTHHRLFAGVEDAGFEIRDTITWHYGSGFPKASDISRTIDKRKGASREKIRENPDSRSDKVEARSAGVTTETPKEMAPITEPATPEAKAWDGWKTGLKPATEYVVVARKPFDGATVDCVLSNGTGALNIGGCRIGTEGGHEHPGTEDYSTTETCYGDGLNGTQSEPVDKGRYPANVVFDEAEAERLDREVGELVSGGADFTEHADNDSRDKYSGEFTKGNERTGKWPREKGGPSRYFYTSKASKAERTLDGRIENAHPTVKPQDLMEWLVTLVTKEGQVVLDPFAGSGTTCKAAKELGREFIGIEQQAKWADVARVRCNLTPNNPEVVRSDDAQEGLEAFE